MLVTSLSRGGCVSLINDRFSRGDFMILCDRGFNFLNDIYIYNKTKRKDIREELKVITNIDDILRQ